MFRMISILALTLSPCIAGGKKGAAGGYQPFEGDILFQSLPNPAGMDLVDAIEGQGKLPLDRKMITPRDLAKAKELTRVHPAG